MTTQFNRQNLQQLQNDINKALAEIAAQRGLNSIQIKGGTFNANMFSCKLEARTVDIAFDPIEVAKQKMALSRYDLPSDTIGRQFVSNGQTFQVERVDTKKPKFPIIAKLVQNGKVTDRA